MVAIVGLVSQLPAILEALNPAGSLEGGALSLRLDDPPGAISADGLSVAWVSDKWDDEMTRAWFAERGAGLVEVLDGVPVGWYPAVVDAEAPA